MSLVISGNAIVPVFAPDEAALVFDGVTSPLGLPNPLELPTKDLLMFRAESDISYTINNEGNPFSIPAFYPEGVGKWTQSVVFSGPVTIAVSKRF